MDAENLELAGDGPAHWNRRVRLVGEQKPNLHVPPTGPQGHHRSGQRGRRAERIDREVRAAGGCVDDGGRNIGRVEAGRLNDGDGTYGACGLESGIGHVHRYNPRSECPSDHHGGQSNPAASVDGQPLVGVETSLGDHGAVRGRKPAAKRRGLDVVERIGEGYEICVGGVNRDELREGSPAGEPRLRLLRADVCVAHRAQLAMPAPAGEWDRHPVTDLPSRHARADDLHGPCQLMPRNHGQRHRVVAKPRVPVGTADARCAHP